MARKEYQLRQRIAWFVKLQLAQMRTIIQQRLLSLRGELEEVAVLFQVSFNHQLIGLPDIVTIERNGALDRFEDGQLFVGQHDPSIPRRDFPFNNGGRRWFQIISLPSHTLRISRIRTGQRCCGSDMGKVSAIRSRSAMRRMGIRRLLCCSARIASAAIPELSRADHWLDHVRLSDIEAHSPERLVLRSSMFLALLFQLELGHD
jgi:hypothetical protein